MSLFNVFNVIKNIAKQAAGALQERSATPTPAPRPASPRPDSSLGRSQAPPSQSPAQAAPGSCIDSLGFQSFFNAARIGHPLGPTLSQDEVNGCTEIITECSRVKFPLSWVAYSLATAYHETAATMRPIKEYGRGHGKPYGVIGPDGQIAYGRGFVQLTWPYNYVNADKALVLNGALVKNYDLALDPLIAAKILIWGMETGKFTGKSLKLYLPAIADIHQFTNARRVVNVLDRAADIANYALEFQAYLQPIWKC